MVSSANTAFLLFLIASILTGRSHGSRILTALVEEQPLAITYHKGALLSANISINLIFYGEFSAAQPAILSDFVVSFSPLPHKSQPIEPSVASWWNSLSKYYASSRTGIPKLRLGKQILDEGYSLGRSLNEADLLKLAARGAPRDAVNVVLTTADV